MMATTEKTVKKLTIHKMKKSAYNALPSKSTDEMYFLTDVGGQVSEISSASADYVGEIVQYVGETNDTYTNGFFYKCTETDGVYSWTQVNVQGGGGGGGLPDQTDNAGKFLTTDGTTASWSDKALVNLSNKETGIVIGTASTGNNGWVVALGYDASATQSSVAVGYLAESNSVQGVAIGRSAAVVNGDRSIAIGYSAKTTAKEAYQIGYGTNSERGTLYVGLSADDGATWQNHKLLDKNGTIPAERMTRLVEVLPTADNGYTTVKNFGNGYVEITGYASIGTVGAGTGSEVQIDLPAGYTMADANYWVNIAPTSETEMFDLKAEPKTRTTTSFMVAYKNEDTTTGLTAAGVYWEVRGMLAAAES